MSQIPDGFLYTEEHEYLKPADEEGAFFVWTAMNEGIAHSL